MACSSAISVLGATVPSRCRSMRSTCSTRFSGRLSTPTSTHQRSAGCFPPARCGRSRSRRGSGTDMRRRLAALGVLGLVMSVALGGQQSAPPSQTPVFRGGVNLVLVDVVVRDRTGAIVQGLTANDFELLEDGVRQQILTFAFEHITTNA